MKKKFKKVYIFEITIAILYVVLSFIYPNKTLSAFIEGLRMVLNLLPIFISVMLFSSFISLFVSPKAIQKRLGKESGFRGILLAAILGTLIVGPMWILFPLYKTLLDKGARMAVIIAMLGTFAIKTPWLPYGATFLGWPFIIITLILTFAYAIFEGYLMEGLFFKRKTKIIDE
jgi:uncharacterized membrane protein YraQ (UPF0718 family)